MAAIVSGFPSKIAALQFEWSFQNTHLTRHIATEDRITARQTVQVISRSTGRTRKRIKRPRDSLNDKLKNLHLLLRVNSFERWPLKLHFFAEDVYKAWERMCKKTIGNVPSSLAIVTDFPVPTQTTKAATQDEKNKDVQQSGIYALSLDYVPMKHHVEKTRHLFLDSCQNSCVVCDKSLNQEEDKVLICPHDQCQMAAHLQCLAHHFLNQDTKTDCLLPVQGQCPSCERQLRWTDLVRELSLRMRGEDAIRKLLNPKARRGKGAVSAAVEEEDEDETDDEHDLIYQHCAEDSMAVDEYEDVDGISSQSSSDQPLAERFNDKTATMSVSTLATSRNRPQKVIPDSDWDDVDDMPD